MNNGGNIQMMTALVLQLIQCSVLLPDEIYEDHKVSRKKNSESKSKLDPDHVMMEKYKTATSIGGNFIQTFLNKCKSRSTETDFRPLFENFIQDLLTTVNKPEWPASELLLTLLGTVLVKYMADKQVDQSIRVASLEYLGLVAARLRKDTVKSRNRVKTMDELIKCIKIEQEKDGEEVSDDESLIDIDPEEERTEFLQRILLDYLLLNSQEENPVWNHSRHFYLSLWYYDIHRRKKEIADGAKGYASRKKSKKSSNHRKRHRGSDDSDDSSSSDVQEVRDRDIDPELNREIFKILDQRKKYLLSKVAPFKKTTRDIIDLKTYLDYDNANLIAQYLASKRRFSQSFDIYLKKIILVVREPVVAIRTRAMKCLGNIVEVDQSILARKDMQLGVAQKLLDTAISVREAAVDLVGKYILTDRTLVDQYYEMIAPRILDTGVSVRKRVIKILRDICSEFPDHPKIPDICIKMLRRVNDEENIQKLVMEVFMTMWFTPCSNNDKVRKTCIRVTYISNENLNF
jgi:cohesin loading factor subunit SCC2